MIEINWHGILRMVLAHGTIKLVALSLRHLNIAPVAMLLYQHLQGFALRAQDGPENIVTAIGVNFVFQN